MQMSLRTRDTYEKLEIPHKVYSNYSYENVHKEFTTYEECVEYLNTTSNSHGNVISSIDDLVISIHSSTHKDIERVYCSDPILNYDIYGLLVGDRTMSQLDDDISLRLRKLTNTISNLENNVYSKLDEMNQTILNLEYLITELQRIVIEQSDKLTQHRVESIERFQALESRVTDLESKN